MVLENVKEMWTETPRLASGKKGRPINKDRFISKMYVLLPNPPLPGGVPTGRDCITLGMEEARKS